VADPEDAGPVIAAAMDLVSGTYALIIDLRHSHGGSPEGVSSGAATCSPAAGSISNDVFHADTGETRQFLEPGFPLTPSSRRSR